MPKMHPHKLPLLKQLHQKRKLGINALLKIHLQLPWLPHELKRKQALDLPWHRVTKYEMET